MSGYRGPKATLSVVGATALLLSWGHAFAQEPVAPGAPAGQAHIEFTYQNDQVQPAHYTITVNEDGTGHFQSEAGPGGNKSDPVPMEGQDRNIEVTPHTRSELFSVARQRKYFSGKCDGGGSRVAFQGKKTLSYRGPDGNGSCEYNWAKDQPLQRITDDFQSIAATLEEGRRLTVEYDHGRLALDAELDTLTDMAKSGRAIELENILPILKTIAGDEAILKRAQRKAQALIDLANKQDRIS